MPGKPAIKLPEQTIPGYPFAIKKRERWNDIDQGLAILSTSEDGAG